MDMIQMAPDARVFVAGHRGLVGSAIVRRLQQEGFSRIETATREQLDLRDQAAVNYWFRAHRPEYIFLVAGTVGGILANSTRPAEFIYDNMMIHATVVHAAHLFPVTRLLYLGSSCIYPRECPQPMKEEHLLSGHLEPTNEPYAIAKIAAHEPLRPERPLRPRELARPARARPQVPRGQGRGPRRGHDLGHRLGAPGVPARRRPRRRLRVPDALLRRARPHQRGHGRGPHDPRARGDGP
jgi:hypothetical protein